MRKRQSRFVREKRAVCAGLFLGVLLCFPACKEPGGQPGITGTFAPTPTEKAVLTLAPGTPTTEPVLTDVPDRPVMFPTETPAVVSPTPVPTEGPEMTAAVTPEPTPEPTEEPTVSPDAEETPTPEPTGQPEYDTLLQNGWQRAEDFFGQREIFFSGKFDRTELIAVPGRYEYRYTASSDAGITFSIIGEENVSIQLFLEELAGNSIECHIELEKKNDYRYLYTDGNYTVEGRIYRCGTDDASRCMRVEFRTAAKEELNTEGHEFYLRETKATE